jgi:hypothetical protein
MDYNFCQFLFQAFGSHYPECLSHILIVDSGWVFSTCWSILKGNGQRRSEEKREERREENEKRGEERREEIERK